MFLLKEDRKESREGKKSDRERNRRQGQIVTARTRVLCWCQLSRWSVGAVSCDESVWLLYWAGVISKQLQAPCPFLGQRTGCHSHGHTPRAAAGPRVGAWWAPTPVNSRAWIPSSGGSTSPAAANDGCGLVLGSIPSSRETAEHWLWQWQATSGEAAKHGRTGGDREDSQARSRTTEKERGDGD